MAQLTVYLTFPGTCEEALGFYSSVFEGAVVSLQRFGDGPMPVTDANRNRVLHAEFQGPGFVLLASDTYQEGDSVVVGSNVSLSLRCDTTEQQDRIFGALARGGTVTMALGDVFWGTRFGMVTDRYGLHWMLTSDTVHP